MKPTLEYRTIIAILTLLQIDVAILLTLLNHNKLNIVGVMLMFGAYITSKLNK